jgi:hypothetical protein
VPEIISVPPGSVASPAPVVAAPAAVAPSAPLGTVDPAVSDFLGQLKAALKSLGGVVLQPLTGPAAPLQVLQPDLTPLMRTDTAAPAHPDDTAAHADKPSDAELADLLAELGAVLVAVHRDGVLGRGADDLLLLADDRQRAVRIAREPAAVGHHACHRHLLSRRS